MRKRRRALLCGVSAALGVGLTLAPRAEAQTCRIPTTYSLDAIPADSRVLGTAGSNGRLGASVGFAANLNNDGLAEILIGAPQASSNRGQTMVWLGNASLNLSATPFATLTGETGLTSRSGSSLSSGRVFGTSISDLIIGAPNYSLGGLTSRGAVYAIKGSSIGGGAITLGTSANIARFIGEATNDLAGFSVLGSGDYDGDGIGDLVIGAYNNNPGGKVQAGSVYLVYGAVTGGAFTLPSTAVKLLGEVAGDYAGISVSSADMNGDGIDDLIIGARNHDPPTRTNGGAVYIFYGNTTRLTGTPGIGSASVKLLGSAAGEGAGTVVTGVGDLNNDGFDDLAVGCATTSDGGRGRVYVVYGSASLASGNLTNHTWFVGQTPKVGANEGDQLGVSIAGGDIDGDGFSDLVLGAPYRDRTTAPTAQDAGAVFILYGTASALSAGAKTLTDLHLAEGSTASGLAGYSLAAGGDTNGDGAAELLIGAPGTSSNAGATYLYQSFAAKTWYTDADGDGFGDLAQSQVACAQPAGTVLDAGDCNDGDGDVYPDADEICDGQDNDCDGLVDDDDPGITDQVTHYYDADGDGYGDPNFSVLMCPPAPPSPWVTNGDDCNDFSNESHPGAAEICDGVDNDCDFLSDDEDPDIVGQDLYYVDADNDGHADPLSASPFCFDPGAPWLAGPADDCDDFEATIHPNATEVCDYLDNNCDGLTDDADPGITGQPTWFADLDGDTFGDPLNTVALCFDPGAPYVSDSSDCNDAAPSINIAAQEICDSADIDEDCDGTSDDFDPSTLGQSQWYHDGDGDSFGDPSTEQLLCDAPDPSFVLDASDCDDTRVDVNPDADEVCDADDIDENCNGLADDTDPGVVDQLLHSYDADSDGYGDPNLSAMMCPPAPPSPWLLNSDDCNDFNSDVNPGATEICDNIDNDCDALIDDADSSLTPLAWYGDSDGDGFGDPSDTVTTCFPPTGYVSNDEDCDDESSTVFPGAPETCNGIDDDCDGNVDTGDTVWYADADQDGHGSDSLFQPIHAACNAQPSGYTNSWGDCKDLNSAIHPDAIETCDGVDQDCDGEIDDNAGPTWYPDADGDGHGILDVLNPPVQACTAPAGYAPVSDDCNDASASVSPSAPEACNGEDDNCNGAIDEGAQMTFYADLDGDGSGNCAVSVVGCAAPAGYLPDCGDCNDNDAAVNRNATELCNGVDDNCDGQTDEPTAADATVWYIDKDGDTFGSAAPPFASITSCSQPAGYVSNDDDCEDLKPEINPSTVWYLDSDGDGFGGNVTLTSCTTPAGYVSNDDDCNDSSASASPSATETCDGDDNDCDGLVDESPAVGATTWYLDADGDGHGTAASTVQACSAPAGYSALNDDCNDGNATVFPANAESCDGVDNDCNGQIDEGVGTEFYADFDGDGYGNPNPAFAKIACAQPAGYVLTMGDCNDGNANANPAAIEVCDNVDNDCNTLVDDGVGLVWYLDADGDGHGTSTSTTIACQEPPGYVDAGDDCDDSDATIMPYAVPYELCDNKDNDCNGVIDDDYAADASIWYQDADSDGFGDVTSSLEACAAPPGYVGGAGDCDDGNAGSFPGATEVCEVYVQGAPQGGQLDNDCDGLFNDDIDAPWWYGDSDNDGYGFTAFQLQSCVPPSERADVVGNYVQNHDDCHDFNASIKPGAPELCNGIDDDCDGQVDDGVVVPIWYRDCDGDGLGNPNVTVQSCSPPTCGVVVYVANGSDTNEPASCP